MKHGAEWYKRDPAAYLGGVQGLTAREHAVYSVVLDLIYHHGGAINNDPRWIAGWISDMGAAAVRGAIIALAQRGKLIVTDAEISQKRAETQVKTREKLRQDREKAGKKGGENSAKSRAEINESNDIGQAIASNENEASFKEKRREEKSNVGGVVARAPELDPPPDDQPPETEGLIWRIIHAIGFDRGQTIPRFWMAPDAPLIVARWLSDLALTEDEVVEVARRNFVQHGEPARGPRILVPVMQAYAAAKAAPPLTPTQPQNPKGAANGRQSEQRAFDTAINQLADGLAAGTVHLDTASRDPWEYARRNGGS